MGTIRSDFFFFGSYLIIDRKRCPGDGFCCIISLSKYIQLFFGESMKREGERGAHEHRVGCTEHS